MSTRKSVSHGGERSLAGAIKDAMALRRVGLRWLSDATAIPYRTLQDYLLERHNIPALALGRIAEALDVSADWLLLGREPMIDKDIIKHVLEDFDEFIRPAIKQSGVDAGAEVFIKLYERNYVLQYSLPGVGVMLAKRKRKAPDESAEGE